MSLDTYVTTILIPDPSMLPRIVETVKSMILFFGE